MGSLLKGVGGAAKGAEIGSIAGPPGQIAGAILGGIGGLFGGDDGPSPEEKAAQELKDAWAGTIVLSPEERKVRFEFLKDQGKITPEMEQQINQADSELKNVHVDPRFKAQQMAALNRISQQGREGFTLEDRAALADVQRQQGQQNRGEQEAIMQNMEARGGGGAGAELAARLQAQQSGADRAGQQGLSVAAQAQQRALQAMAQSGTLAGEMGNNDFNQQAKINSAQDAINNFNTGNRVNQQQRNVAATNVAAEANLKNKQALETNRVNTINAQQKSDVQNKVDWATDNNARTIGAAGQAMNVADQQRNSQKRDAQGFTDTLGGIGEAAKTVGNVTKDWTMPEWLKNKPATQYGDSKNGRLTSGE